MTGFTFGSGGEGFKLDSDSWDIGIDSSFDQPRSEYTVPTNAVQSMTPVDSGASSGGWGNFWQDTLKTAIGYTIAKDAAQNGVPMNSQQRAMQQQAQQRSVVIGPTGVSGGLIPLALLGIGAFLVIRAVAK